MAYRARATTPSFGPMMLVVGLAVSVSACRRKAPGPDECVAFAQHAVGVRSPAELELESVRANVDELTTECLLTPYDYELLACVEQTGALRGCQRAFLQRHAGIAPVSPRTRSPRRRRDNPF